MLLYVLLFMLVISGLLFIHKVVYKRRLERGLGRKVDDHELISLTSWMAVEDDKARK
jgi:hypothetical protein